jgi:Domain of unknown function (DUF4304)
MLNGTAGIGQAYQVTMKEITDDLVSHVRTLGFKGSAPTFRRLGNDGVFVIHLQKYRAAERSAVSEKFFINLGAQPACIPVERDADLRTLKEPQCVMRTRVGKEWMLHMTDAQFLALKSVLDAVVQEFAATVEALPAAFRTHSADALLDRFGIGLPRARAALHLARGARSLGFPVVADELVERGLALAGERATMLIEELLSLRDG